MKYRVIVVAFFLSTGHAFAEEPKPPVLTPEEQKLADEAQKLNYDAVQLYQRGQPMQAIEKFRQSLKIRQQVYATPKFSDGHPDLADSFNNIGVVLQFVGQAEQAVPYFRQGLEMNQRLFPAAKHPDGHFNLATSLNNMGGVWQALGQLEQALPYFRQAHEMKQRLFPVAQHPNGNAELALSFHNYGSLLQAMGQSEQALPMLQQGADMMRKLSPTGHPNLASSLNTIGVTLHAMGKPEQALDYFRQGLEMRQKLFPSSRFPNGHPHVATSLNNMGFVLDSMNRTEEAMPYFQQGLEMRQKLFPRAHPDVVQSLQNMGFALQALGKTNDSLPYYRSAVAMAQKLFPESMYPDGHPDLAHTISNLGGILDAMGQSEEALGYYRQSMVMQQRTLRRELATASEEAAFDKISAETPYINTYLTLSHTIKTPGEQSYELIWPTRSVVTRLLEQRQANARAAGTEAGDKLNRLRDLRRQTDQLLRNTRMPPEERDRQLVAVSNERDQIERDLAAEIPALKRRQELDRLGPADLAKALPDGAVFIDVIRYMRLEYVDKKKRKGTPSYAAFVVAKTSDANASSPPSRIQRVELGDAVAIDSAVRQWRKSIDEQRAESQAAAELTRRVWEPIRKALLPSAKTLYITADGDLARVPWAALPIDNNRVLLEEFAVAMALHGMHLLEQLTYPRKYEGVESALILGGVEYGEKWPKLPGTWIEMNAIAALAPSESETASRGDASIDFVSKGLSKARWAHLATHGEFKADELALEKQRAAKLLESRFPGDNSRRIAAKNPLGYVGLVLAKGEILSGLRIVDFKLDNLKLVTLSACETGLGELTGGEGVQGLQRAFHLAGCPNVVASLWKVNDAATAALMAKFYHELWVKKKPPIEALREAQLTIYRHPELIPDLAGERGAPKARDSLAVKPLATSQKKRADTKLWASFVLSGVGN